MCDQIAAERQSLKAAMADLEADHSCALDILSRNLSDSEIGVTEAVSKRSSLSAACSKLAAEVRAITWQYHALPLHGTCVVLVTAATGWLPQLGPGQYLLCHHRQGDLAQGYMRVSVPCVRL